MNAASLIAKRALLGGRAIVPTRVATVACSGTLCPVINKTWDRDGTASDRLAWSAIAAASAGLLLGADACSSCERSRKTNVVDPRTFPLNRHNSRVDDDASKSGQSCHSSKQGIFEDKREDSAAVRDDSSSVNVNNTAKSEIQREKPKEVQLQPTPSSSSQAVEAKPRSSDVPMPGSEVRVGADAVSAAPSPTATATATSPNAMLVESSKYASDMSAEELRIEEATRKAKQHSGGLKLFSGNGNMSLALEIARYLGITLGRATVGRFADGEVNVVIHEHVRGKDVYVVQPTCPPVNDNIMELLLMVSTMRRASARRITVVIPYYGYARQDRKMQARVPISAADVARLMEAMGIDRVIAVDLHCGQIQGFFGPRVPVDNLDGGIVGLDYFGSKDLINPVVVSPDAGGVYRAKKFKEGLAGKYDMPDIGLAMIVKQRARAGSVDKMDLVGDVTGCDCILVDDMIDTAGTLCKAADVLVANGARRVFAFASHGLLSGPGNERIANSKMEEVVILNTIPTSPQREANDKLTVLSVAPLLAQTIFNIHAKKSVSALFK